MKPLEVKFDRKEFQNFFAKESAPMAQGLFARLNKRVWDRIRNTLFSE